MALSESVLLGIGITGCVLAVLFFVANLALSFVFKKKHEESIEGEREKLIKSQQDLLGLRNELTAMINSVRQESAIQNARTQENLNAFQIDFQQQSFQLSSSFANIQATLEGKMDSMQTEYREYFDNFKGEVSKEVDIQFKSENMQPKLDAFRIETDQKFQAIGDEKLAQHSAKQGELYQAMNDNLEALNEKGMEQQAEWTIKLENCQQQVTERCNAEFTSLTLRSNQFCEQSYSNYVARLESDNTRYIQKFADNFNAQSQAIVNSTTEQINVACARMDQQVASSTGLITATLATAQGEIAASTNRMEQKWGELDRETRRKIDENTSWFECEIKKQIKNSKWELEQSFNTANEDTQWKVAECEKKVYQVEKDLDECNTELQSVSKKVGECDWWIRENDKKLWTHNESVEKRVEDIEAKIVQW